MQQHTGTQEPIEPIPNSQRLCKPREGGVLALYAQILPVLIASAKPQGMSPTAAALSILHCTATEKKCPSLEQTSIYCCLTEAMALEKTKYTPSFFWLGHFPGEMGLSPNKHFRLGLPGRATASSRRRQWVA